MIYTLAFRWFSLHWTNLDQLYLKRPQVLTAEKNPLILALPFLGELSLEARTKLQKYFKTLANISLFLNLNNFPKSTKSFKHFSF